jgi:hypothetical protein
MGVQLGMWAVTPEVQALVTYAVRGGEILDSIRISLTPQGARDRAIAVIKDFIRCQPDPASTIVRLVDGLVGIWFDPLKRGWDLAQEGWNVIGKDRCGIKLLLAATATVALFRGKFTPGIWNTAGLALKLSWNFIAVMLNSARSSIPIDTIVINGIP